MTSLKTHRTHTIRCLRCWKTMRELLDCFQGNMLITFFIDCYHQSLDYGSSLWDIQDTLTRLLPNFWYNVSWISARRIGRLWFYRITLILNIAARKTLILIIDRSSVLQVTNTIHARQETRTGRHFVEKEVRTGNETMNSTRWRVFSFNE